MCGCYKGGSQCYQDCVEDALIEKSLFYNVGVVSHHNLLLNINFTSLSRIYIITSRTYTQTRTFG